MCILLVFVHISGERRGIGGRGFCGRLTDFAVAHRLDLPASRGLYIKPSPSTANSKSPAGGVLSLLFRKLSDVYDVCLRNLSKLGIVREKTCAIAFYARGQLQ